MKTSNVLASLLFGSITVAAPVNKRALITHTEIVVETQIVYTTVWDYDQPAAEATTTPAGLFYEQPAHKTTSTTKTSTTSSAKKPQEPAYTPPTPLTPITSSTSTTFTSIYTPPPKPTSVYTPPAPAPEPTTSAYVAPPAPSSTYVAPAPSSTPSEPTGSQPSGTKYHGDITIYDNTGAAGACGKPLTDDMMICAMAKPVWGESTYDVMTGEATNPWCGKEITLQYKGNQITCTVMDLCPVCAYGDVDLSLSAWKALTGLDEKTRLQADWYAN